MQALSRYTAMQLATDRNHYLLELAKALRRFAGEGEIESERGEFRSLHASNQNDDEDSPSRHVDLHV